MAGPLVALIWPQVWIYNPLVGLILALFFSLSLRFFIRFFLDRNRPRFIGWWRIVAGIVWMALACLYALFAWPLLVWDRPARAVVATTAALIVLWTVARHGRAQSGIGSRSLSGLVKVILFIALLFVATLTILRTGYIALTGHRVTLLVNVTGETRPEPVSWTPPGGTPRQESLTTHHVIITLPSGKAAADVWIYGDALAVHGKVIRFSERLHQMGIPFLYELQFLHNDYSTEERKLNYPTQVVSFPASGALAVHPWWKPLQSRLLNYLADRGARGLRLGITISGDDTPSYPLVGANGEPAQKLFLLILQPWGTTTSRGSSPLEDKYRSRH